MSDWLKQGLKLSAEAWPTQLCKNTDDGMKVKVKVKLRFSAPSAGIAEIEQT